MCGLGELTCIMYMQVSVVARRRHGSPLTQELKEIVYHLIWVLATDLRVL